MCLEKLHPWAHSAFPFRKDRSVQWMSLYSKTAFTSNFQAYADEMQSNSRFPSAKYHTNLPFEGITWYMIP